MPKGSYSEKIEDSGILGWHLSLSPQLLSSKYHWVITNVPYLARGKQGDRFKEFCQEHYNEAKQDLATVFLDRCLEFCLDGANVSVVLPQNWLFLTSYKIFRQKLLKKHKWKIIARLGPGAFETISGEIVKAILLSMSLEDKNQSSGLFNEKKIDYSNFIRSLDVSALRTAKEKAQQLIIDEIQEMEQEKQLDNPDARIALYDEFNGILLNRYAFDSSGCLTGDSERFYRNFWEVINNNDWEYLQTTVSATNLYSGRFLIIFWQNGKGELFKLAESVKKLNHAAQNWRRGQEVWRKKGVAISSMGNLPVTLYDGSHFDNNIAVIIPNNSNHLLSIWCFCSSPEYNEAVRRIDQKLNVTNATLVKVPFDLDYWQKVAEEKYPNGLPKPYSDDPTQWIFHGHPVQSEHPLQVAVALLLGYRWPAETDEKMELAVEAWDWIKKCQQLLPYADEDGIVCIPSVRGETPAADRLLNLLAAAYGNQWSTDRLSQLLKQADHEGKTLETWLREKFFSQHCKLFHHRPFIWHIWDGLPDGFAALVNYHKFNYKNLETLIYLYLVDWSKRQKDDMDSGIDGAGERLAAAENLKKKLEMILEGENPYDIFVRWKPLEQQPIGWNPDLNDGVRLNIRPLMTVPEVRKKGAGVLRDRPNINWKKDRGTDVESAPWYQLFKGERINDYHLSLAEKHAARK